MGYMSIATSAEALARRTVDLMVLLLGLTRAGRMEM